jgi:hypothetical protein
MIGSLITRKQKANTNCLKFFCDKIREKLSFTNNYNFMVLSLLYKKHSLMNESKTQIYQIGNIKILKMRIERFIKLSFKMD